MIGIRVDGNSKIGTGHISRCLSIASALRKKNKMVIFICSGDTPIEQISDQKFNVIVLKNSRHDKWMIEEELNCIKANSISILFLDSYYVTEENLELLHKETKLVYLDDLHIFDYDVDAIINYNIDATEEMYINTKYRSRRIYLGVGYFPLKESFCCRSSSYINKEVKNVLITSGGTDPFHCIHRILSSIDFIAYEKIKFTIILGIFFENKYSDFLKKEFSGYNNLVFLEWGQDMKKLYSESDIVIAPGSTTLYEALSFGVPCISFKFSDNHHAECLALEKMNIVPFAGDYSKKINDIAMNQLFREELSFTRRKEQFERFMNLFDGNGSDRIADIIIDIDNENRV